MPTRLALFLLGAAVLAGAGHSTGQDKPKKDEPARGDKDDRPVLKGTLPAYWKQLGVSDAQKQAVYKLNAKYNAEIDRLEAQIKELKTKRDRERTEILTPDQKKRLEAIIREKAGTDK